jgi:hypothetical protein
MNVAMRRVAVSSPNCFLCHLGLAFVAICSCNANVVGLWETAFFSNVAISSSLPVGATTATRSWSGAAVLPT